MLKRFETSFKKIEVNVALGVIFFLLISALLRLLLRNWGSSELASGLTEKISLLLPHGVLALGFLGASIGLSRGEAIAIDAIVRLFPKPIATFLSRIVFALAAMILIVFVYLAFVYRDIDNSWPVNAILIPGLIVLLFKSILRIFISVEEVRSLQKDDSA